MVRVHLRDRFALAAAGHARTFPDVAPAVLRLLLTGLALDRPVADAVQHVQAGIAELGVHPDVPAILLALAEAGVRVVTLTNGSPAQSGRLLSRAGVQHLVERRLSVDDAGPWKPPFDAHPYAARACGVPLEHVMVAVHRAGGHQRSGGVDVYGATGGSCDRRGLRRHTASLICATAILLDPSAVAGARSRCRAGGSTCSCSIRCATGRR